MALLDNAAPGSKWRLRNGEIATYIRKSVDPRHREHTLQAECDEGTDVYLWRYGSGMCDPCDTHPNAWDPIAPVTSKYPSNYANRSH